MVPPWVPDLPPPDADNAEDGQGQDEAPPQVEPSVPVVPDVPIAPARRFYGSRLNLGKFGKSGNHDDLRRGVGQYFRTGLGGTRTAVKRFGGTARTAGTLYGALETISGARPAAANDPLNPAALLGRSGREIITAVIEVVAPVDGTQDTEAAKPSINDALSALAERFPDVDLLRLTEQQRDFVIECYLGLDVYRRFVLDVGGAIRDAAPTASVALARLKEAKNYIRETIAAAFRKLRQAGARSARQVSQLVHTTLRDAIDVFQEYAE